MSLRLRLTLTYCALLALIVAAFGAVLYSTLRQNLEREMDRRLRVRASQVELTIWPGTSSLKPEDLTAARLDLSPLAELDAPGVYVQVVDRNGTVVATSTNLKDASLPTTPSTVADALQGKNPLRTVPVGLDRSVRILSLPVTVSGKVVGVLQVGQSRQPLEQTMADLRTLLLLLGGGALALGAGVGWLVAQRGLQPLRTMAERAALITRERDFSRRLALPARHDEVGELAATVDQLLATVDDLLTRHREFVADTSHELRNPLLAVRTNLDLLDRVRDEAARAECIREAREQADRMSRLVADLLLLARAEAGQFIEHKPVALLPLVEAVWQQTVKRAAGQTVRLTHSEALEVIGDHGRLHQVLDNLATNALRHTPADGTISFALEQVDGWARLTVTDTGEGIASDDLPHIFDRFYQAQQSSGQPGQGSGLGLAIVRHLVNAHGGHVTVRSSCGVGSTFAAWLPLAGGAPTADGRLPHPVAVGSNAAAL